MEKLQKVKIYYIRSPKGMKSWLEPKANAYATVTTQLSCNEDITSEEATKLVKDYFKMNPEGYEMVHMECFRTDEDLSKHFGALWIKFQENGVIRSMMVGDIIQVDDKYYACAGVGWKQLEEFNI